MCCERCNDTENTQREEDLDLGGDVDHFDVSVHKGGEKCLWICFERSEVRVSDNSETFDLMKYCTSGFQNDDKNIEYSGFHTYIPKSFSTHHRASGNKIPTHRYHDSPSITHDLQSHLSLIFRWPNIHPWRSSLAGLNPNRWKSRLEVSIGSRRVLCRRY
jgi:hypothetical protein